MTHCFSSQWAENDFTGIKSMFDQPDRMTSSTPWHDNSNFRKFYLPDFYMFIINVKGNFKALSLNSHTNDIPQGG
jgi:hypothetical protein